MDNILDNTLKNKSIPSICQISFDYENKWGYGIITYMDMENGLLEIFLSTQCLENYLGTHKRVELKYIHDENEYYILGIIDKKVRSLNKHSLIIRIDKTSYYPNKRKNERYYSGFAATITVKESDITPAVLNNISIRGVSLFTSISIEEKQNIKISIIVSQSKSINFTGKILKKSTHDNGFRYSIKIEWIDNENAEYLKELIMFLAENKKHVLNEFIQFKKVRNLIYAAFAMMIFFIIMLIWYLFL